VQVRISWHSMLVTTAASLPVASREVSSNAPRPIPVSSEQWAFLAALRGRADTLQRGGHMTNRNGSGWRDPSQPTKCFDQNTLKRPTKKTESGAGPLLSDQIDIDGNDWYVLLRL
jgi:hypothetical protein